MWRLTTLGGLSIERLERIDQHEGSSPLPVPAAQRRPLALLAVLATAGEQGICRDDLLLYFWPDSDVERARNALRQTLFRLRRDLGPQDPVTGTVHLRLDPTVIVSDVAEFEAALARGKLDAAAALYRGPFLSGVSIGGLPEFEQWAVAERARLAQRFTAAVESLAHAANVRRDYAGAIAWWRQLAAADATNDRAALGLMTALSASGDRDGALQYYRLHELLLRDELGVTDEQTVEALVDRLSDGRSEDVTATSDGAGRRSASESRQQSVARRIEQSPIRWSLVVSIAVVVIAALGRAASESKARSLASSVSPDVIAVLPFVARGGASSEAIAVAVSDLLSSAIDGAGGLRVADRRALRQSIGSDREATTNASRAQAIAVRYGAGRMVLGEVMAAGTHLSITATLYEHGRSPTRIAELAADGARDDIATITHALARQLLASAHPEPTGNLIRSAAQTTASLPALRAYLDGERHFQNGDFAPALEAFQRAVHEDTTFAIAYYRLSVAADWASHPTLPAEALGSAVRLVDRVPEHDQKLIRALAAWRQGRGAEALHLYRELVAQYPADVEAWYQLGEVLFHAGPAYGHHVLDARPAFERALEFRPGARESLIHLVRLAAKVGDARGVDSLTQRVLAMDSTKDVVEMRLFRALTGRNEAGVRRVIETLRTSPDEAVLTAAWRAGVFAEDLVHAEDISRLLMDPSRRAGYQVTGRWYVASLELARGRWKAARTMLAPGFPAPVAPNAEPGTDSGSSLAGAETHGGWSVDAIHAGHLGLMAAMPIVPLPPDEIAAVRRRVVDWPEPPPELSNWPNLFQPTMRDYVLGLLSLRAGDTSAAVRHADRLDLLHADAGIRTIARGASLTLRAEVARRAGDRERALAMLDAAPILATLSSVMQARAYDRFLRAELVRELGRDDEALRWYATQGQSFVPDLIYLAPAYLRQAEIYDRRGDTAKAVAHYRRFVELWREAEPELQPYVAAARGRISVLGSRQ